MYKGISLHIGVSSLSLANYLSAASLSSPENDAKAMAELARQEHYETRTVLINEQATRFNVLKHFSECSDALNAGDTFLLTFSGHGGQVEDINFDEEDGKDERWCLYDDYLLDDEIGNKWKEFREGVRIIVVSSSCHSRTALKPGTSESWIRDKQAFSDWKQRQLVRTAPYLYPEDPEILAGIIHLSACRDDQQARDGDQFSRFTGLLLKHWDQGRFNGNYQDLVAKINREAGYLQKSDVALLGKNRQELLNSIPFKLLTHKT